MILRIPYRHQGTEYARYDASTKIAHNRQNPRSNLFNPSITIHPHSLIVFHNHVIQIVIHNMLYIFSM